MSYPWWDDNDFPKKQKKSPDQLHLPYTGIGGCIFDPHYSRKNVRGEPGFLCPFMQVSPHLVYAERWSLEPKNGKSSLLVFGGDQTMRMDFFIIFLIFTCFRQTERGNRRRISIQGDLIHSWLSSGLATQKQIPLWSLPLGIQDRKKEKLLLNGILFLKGNL